MKNCSERVSIVLPFYRAGKYITEAIESILGQQDYNDWRLYLVDDGSDDRDVEVAQCFSRKYSSTMRLLQHLGRSHCGISAARNLGISKSQGEFIAFLDADDVWYPHKLRSQIAILDANPAAGMVYGPALRWRSWAGGIDERVPAKVDGFGTDCLVPGSALLETFLRDEALTPCTGSVVIRRAALQRSGCFEESFRGLYDDQVLYAKLCLSNQVFVSSDCVSKYRKHTESCCSLGAADGSGEAVREQFLNWLREYRNPDKI